MLELSSEVRYIKGVGDVRMKLYQKLGIETVEQLLHHIPRRYLDLRETCPVRLMRPGEMRQKAGSSVSAGGFPSGR